MPYPGASYYAEFTTANPTTGAAQNADSPPTATATRNGTDDATFTLTVTNIDTGRYKVTGVIPASYAEGDSIQISAAATVASVAGKGIIDQFILVAAPNAAISDFPFIMTLSSDHFSPALGKTVAATRAADAGAFVPCDNTGTIIEKGNGWYTINLTANDMTFTSSLALQFAAAGCDITGFTLTKD